MAFPWQYIGPVVSAGLLAFLPEPGRLDRRAVASLAGLAPKAHESGKFRGKRRIGQGRSAVRTLAYMASLSLWRSKSNRDAIARMMALGKPKKVILIALARKLVTIANAVIRDQTPFKTTPQTWPRNTVAEV